MQPAIVIIVTITSGSFESISTRPSLGGWVFFAKKISPR